MGDLGIYGGGLLGAGWTDYAGTSAENYNTMSATLAGLSTQTYYNAVRQVKVPTLPLFATPKPLSFYDKLRKEIDEWIKL